jgi:Zn ribbon nucleic-acid-binding protein
MRKKKESTKKVLEDLKTCIENGHDMRFVANKEFLSNTNWHVVSSMNWDVVRECVRCGHRTEKMASEIERLAIRILEGKITGG